MHEVSNREGTRNPRGQWREKVGDAADSADGHEGGCQFEEFIHVGGRTKRAGLGYKFSVRTNRDGCLPLLPAAGLRRTGCF
jgi:hypothetical protein